MIPLWLKVAYTVFVAILVPVYARKYGPTNFLWFSDIALLVTVPALWFESALLASMMALGVLLPEVVWNVSFFVGLFAGRPVLGLAGYMFDPEKPRYLRALSLFHIFLPVLLVWLVARLGYEADALVAQTALAWVVLPLTYAVTDPERNINWVHGPAGEGQRRIPPVVYLVLLMIAFPLLVYGPTHLLLRALLG